MDIWAIGGYSEIGRNMTAVRVGNDVVVLDMGVWVEKLAAHEDGNPYALPLDELYQTEILPNDREFRKKWGKDVKAILISHAHLDHSAGVVRLASLYDAPVVGTPFTIEVIKNLLREGKGRFPNELVKVNPGSRYKISEDMWAEFIYATHSTPQTVMIALHTREGTLLYANDFKFDPRPVLGKPMNMNRLRILGEDGVKVLITDTTRIDRPRKTFSESIEKEMLREVLTMIEGEGKLLLITTFASHVARVNTIVDLAEKIGKEPIILGRSMLNYIDAAEKVGIIRIRDRAKVASRKKELKQIFRLIEREGRDKFLLITTGNQGEPNSILSKMADDRLPFRFEKGDIVIFASETIPSPVNMANRAELERKLKAKGVRIFKDVHVSGHASREDHRDFLKIIRPEHYVPTHGYIEKLASAISLAVEEGYELGKDAHLLQNGQMLSL
ncbi:MAG: MBL fold metallo-hydrolase [Nanoarchaeota archaeon]|nr:MBL fold metallo-hydrolase [Nanoarchaeota archaeon]